MSDAAVEDATWRDILHPLQPCLCRGLGGVHHLRLFVSILIAPCKFRRDCMKIR